MADEPKGPPRINRPMALPTDAELDDAAKVSDDATDAAVAFWHERSQAKYAGLVDATTPEEKRG
jgi:hypothetical protein